MTPEDFDERLLRLRPEPPGITRARLLCLVAVALVLWAVVGWFTRQALTLVSGP